jgi:hypothetical protein
LCSPEITYGAGYRTAPQRRRPGQGHQRHDVVAQLLDFRRQPVADLLEIQAGEILVQIVGGTDEFGWE